MILGSIKGKSQQVNLFRSGQWDNTQESQLMGMWQQQQTHTQNRSTGFIYYYW